jgi:hypothetical protein
VQSNAGAVFLRDGEGGHLVFVGGVPIQHNEELLSSEHGTYKTVKARFWRWLSGKSPSNLF